MILPCKYDALAQKLRRDGKTANRAQAPVCIEPKDGSWYFSIKRTLSAMISSTLCTTESGGSPPSLTDRSIEPRAGHPDTELTGGVSCAPIRSPEPAGEYVMMIEAGRAAVLHQLAHAGQRREPDDVLVEVFQIS